MSIARAATVDSSFGSYPYCNPALTNVLVPILSARQNFREPRMVYTSVIGNPSAAVAYLQLLVPTVSGFIAGQASLATPGAQTGVQLSLAPGSALLVSGNTYLLDTDFPRARGTLTAAASRVETLVVTVTAGPTVQSDGSNLYTVSFTTAVAHAVSGPISFMGWATAPATALGTVAPAQSYGPVGAGSTTPLIFGDIGNGYPFGFAIAGTTGPTNAVAPSVALVVNLGIA